MKFKWRKIIFYIIHSILQLNKAYVYRTYFLYIAKHLHAFHVELHIENTFPTWKEKKIDVKNFAANLIKLLLLLLTHLNTQLKKRNK